MFFVHKYDSINDKYSVVDTEDWVEEWYSFDEIMNFVYNNIKIQGASYNKYRVLTIDKLCSSLQNRSNLFSKGINYRLERVLRNNTYFDIICIDSVTEPNIDSRNIDIADCILSLPDYLFSGKGFRSIYLRNNIQAVGVSCMENCKELEFVKFSDKQGTIPKNCCKGCNKLRDVRLGVHTTYIEDDAFLGCADNLIIQIPYNSSLCLSEEDCKRVGITLDNLRYNCVYTIT